MFIISFQSFALHHTWHIKLKEKNYVLKIIFFFIFIVHRLCYQDKCIKSIIKKNIKFSFENLLKFLIECKFQAISSCESIIRFSFRHNPRDLAPITLQYGLQPNFSHHWVNFIQECWDLQFKVSSEGQIFWELFSWQFYLLSGTYSLKSTPNDRFFEKLFMAVLIKTLRVFARNLLRGNRRKNTFCIWF